MPPDHSISMEPCKHAFCRECIKGHIDANLDGRKYPIMCPVCVTSSLYGTPGGMCLYDVTILLI